MVHHPRSADDLDDEPVFRILLFEDRAVIPQDGRLGQFLEGETEPRADPLFRESLFEGFQQQGESGAVASRDVDAVSGDMRMFKDKVTFVHDLQCRDAFGTEVLQDLFRHPQVVFVLRRGRVADVQDDVRGRRFFQRRVERFHQLVGQVPDEADGVDQHDLPSGGKAECPGRWVQRREEFVFGEDAGLGQGVHQRRLAGIGVAHQGDGLDAGLFPSGAEHVAPLFHVLQFLPDGPDAPLDVPAVRLQLRLTGTAGADAGAESREARALTGEPGQAVLQLGEFDLETAFSRACPLGEDVEDERRAVDDAGPGRLLDVAQLGRREFAVEDEEVAEVRVHHLFEFFDFAGAEVQSGIGGRAHLQDRPDDFRAGGPGQFPQFFEGDFGFGPRPTSRADGRRNGFRFRERLPSGIKGAEDCPFCGLLFCHVFSRCMSFLGMWQYPKGCLSRYFWWYSSAV